MKNATRSKKKKLVVKGRLVDVKIEKRGFSAGGGVSPASARRDWILEGVAKAGERKGGNSPNRFQQGCRGGREPEGRSEQHGKGVVSVPGEISIFHFKQSILLLLEQKRRQLSRIEFRIQSLVQNCRYIISRREKYFFLEVIDRIE